MDQGRHDPGRQATKRRMRLLTTVSGPEGVGPVTQRNLGVWLALLVAAAITYAPNSVAQNSSPAGSSVFAAKKLTLPRVGNVTRMASVGPASQRYPVVEVLRMAKSGSCKSEHANQGS